MRQLEKNFVVSAQILPEHVAQIAGAGFRTIICNRPDGEEAGQASFGEIEKAAVAEGIACLHIPVSHAGLTRENVEETRAALKSAPKPIFAYCRSGTRSAQLYQFATLAPS